MSGNRNVRRLIGGAGTGKTSAILDEMNRGIDELGLSPRDIGFVTFTRNGRQVMARRASKAWGCDESLLTKQGHFRTAHSTALKQTGVSRDQLLTDNRESKEWLAGHLDGDFCEGDDESGEVHFATDSEAGRSLELWSLSRNTLRPLAEVYDLAIDKGDRLPGWDAVKETVERYESAKRIDKRLDYTDLLAEFAGVSFHVSGHLNKMPVGDVPEMRMLCIDEAQDASALVDRVCRRMAESPSVERCLIVGDNFQSIFGFSGGSAKHFMSWDAEQTIMPRSYRCPAPIMELGEQCLQEMRHGYFPRDIAPASHDGVIEQAGDCSEAISSFIDLREKTLILARCDYSLRRYEAELTQQGIPYARLGYGGSNVHVGCKALWNLQCGETVRNDQWAAAVQLITANGEILIRGAKSAWERGGFADFDLIRREDLQAVGCSASGADLIATGGWMPFIAPRHQSEAEKWVDAANRHGPELASSPKVELSTIHAAKGAEADTVILCSESSRQVQRSSSLSDCCHDEECRLAYVAVTRARRRLVIVEDGRRHRIALPFAC